MVLLDQQVLFSLVDIDTQAPPSQMSEKQQRLVYAILDFLNQSIKDGTVRADDQEGLEVASMLSVFTHSCQILTSPQYNA
jgi:hypothetical protein